MAWACLSWEMWSGLLPPGLNESDVDLSSDDGDESHGSFSKEDVKDVEGVEVPELQENGPESNATREPIVISAIPEENESQPCPSGISLRTWNVGIVTGLQLSRV